MSCGSGVVGWFDWKSQKNMKMNGAHSGDWSGAQDLRGATGINSN